MTEKCEQIVLKLNECHLQVRRKVPQAPAITLYDNKPQYTSEPHLSDESESLPQPHQMRRGSTRRTPQSNQAAYAPGMWLDM